MGPENTISSISRGVYQAAKWYNENAQSVVTTAQVSSCTFVSLNDRFHTTATSLRDFFSRKCQCSASWWPELNEWLLSHHQEYFINSLAREKCCHKFKSIILNTLYRIAAWTLAAKLLMGECHWNSLVKYWTLAPWGNEQLPEPKLSQIYVVIWPLGLSELIGMDIARYNIAIRHAASNMGLLPDL